MSRARHARRPLPVPDRRPTRTSRPTAAWSPSRSRRRAPKRDGYRHAIWAVPADGSASARQLTLGAKHDVHPRFSPDGRTLAFLSDRRSASRSSSTRLKPKEPRGRRPDPPAAARRRRGSAPDRPAPRRRWVRLGAGRQSASSSRPRLVRRRCRRTPGPAGAAHASRPATGIGLPLYRPTRLLRSTAAASSTTATTISGSSTPRTGEAPSTDRRTDGESSPAWSPDGRTDRLRRASWPGRGLPRPTLDLARRRRVGARDADHRRSGHLLDADVVRGWRLDRSPSGTALGHAQGRGRTSGASRPTAPTRAGTAAQPDGASRPDVRLGDEQRHRRRAKRLAIVPTPGDTVLAIAPADGSDELWRVSIDDGAMERLTAGRHYVSSFDAVAGARGSTRVALLLSDPVRTSDVDVIDVPAARVRAPLTPVRRTALNDEVLATSTSSSRRSAGSRSTATGSRAGSIHRSRRPGTAVDGAARCRS